MCNKEFVIKVNLLKLKCYGKCGDGFALVLTMDCLAALTRWSLISIAMKPLPDDPYARSNFFHLAPLLEHFDYGSGPTGN